MGRSNISLIFLVVVLVVGVSPVSGVERSCTASISSSLANEWETLASGLEYRGFEIHFDDGSTSRMSGVRLDPNQFRIRLLWQSGKDAELWGASEASRKTRATVVINAGYFDENKRPMGYFRSGGKDYNSRLLYRGSQRALHLGAVFYVKEQSGEVGISTREAFQPIGVQEAFQAGPYLVHNGIPDSGLEAYREFRRPDRRTVLAIGKKGWLLLLVSEEFGRGISWCELQNVLARPESAGGFGVTDAMNLDGGSSSQLYVRGNGSLHRLLGRAVPALMIFVPRMVHDGS